MVLETCIGLTSILAVNVNALESSVSFCCIVGLSSAAIKLTAAEQLLFEIQAYMTVYSLKISQGLIRQCNGCCRLLVLIIEEC